ncbi:hypothetical protein ACKWTF_015117 [Chironomus riparius]
MYFIIFVLYLGFSDGFFVPNRDYFNVLRIFKALNDVVDEFFIKSQIPFNIIGDSEDFYDLDGFYSKLLGQNDAQFSYWTLTLMRIQTNLEDSAMIFVKDCEGYGHVISQYVLINNYPKTIKILIYIDVFDFDGFWRQIELFMPTNVIYNTAGIKYLHYLLINEQDAVKLSTIEWYTKAVCNQPRLKVLNLFNKTTQNWIEKLKNYEKFQNFYGCNLTLGIDELDESDGRCWQAIISRGRKVKDWKVLGLGPKIFKMNSKLHNYIPNHYPLGSEAEDVDVYLPVFRYDFESRQHFHVTSTFSHVRDIIITSIGEPYSSYEKLLLPFDDTTWKLLISTFLMAFIAIIVINRMPSFIQERVYGEQIQSPALNVISTFFGIAQAKLPTKHIPRFILIFFVFFCLIFRTCYQSKMFEFMTSEIRWPPPTSIKDLKDKNFIMYTNHSAKKVNSRIGDEIDNW